MGDEDLKDFKCVDFFRKIKDEISVELNAMTPNERHLYFERENIEARAYFERKKRKRDIAK
jgi:hypothetical protein